MDKCSKCGSFNETKTMAGIECSGCGYVKREISFVSIQQTPKKPRNLPQRKQKGK